MKVEITSWSVLAAYLTATLCGLNPALCMSQHHARSVSAASHSTLVISLNTASRLFIRIRHQEEYVVCIISVGPNKELLSAGIQAAEKCFNVGKLLKEYKSNCV